MTINSQSVAMANARKSRTAKKGSCQLWTRTMFNAPSAGDQDGDGDADANDGWLSEPKKYRHADLNFPGGVSGYFKNESGHGFGHRVVTLDNGLVRSIDFDTKTKSYKPGTVGTGTPGEVARALGLVWMGWAQSISGHLIPDDEKPAPKPTPKPTPKPPVKKTSRGLTVDAALQSLGKARSTTKKTSVDRLKAIDSAIVEVKKIPFIK